MSIFARRPSTRFAVTLLAVLALLVSAVPAIAGQPVRPAGDDVVRKVVASRIRIATWPENGTCYTAADLWYNQVPGAIGYEYSYLDGGVRMTGTTPPTNDNGLNGLPKGVGKMGLAALWGDASPCGGRGEAERGYKDRFKGPTKVTALLPVGTGFIKGTVLVIDCHLGNDQCKPAAKMMGAQIVATRKGKSSTATSGVDGTYLFSGKPGSYELRPKPIPGWTWTQKVRTASVTKNVTTFVNFTVRVPPGGDPPVGDPGIGGIKRRDKDPLGLLGHTPCAGPDQGLVSCWRFEGNLTDAKGDNDGSPVNGEDYAPGAVDQGLNLNRYQSMVQVPDADSLDTPAGGSMTISAWVLRLSTNPAQHIVGKRSACDGADFPWQIHLDAGRTFFGTSTGGTPTFASVDGLPPVLDWQHLVGTADGEKLRLYVDGNLVATKAGSLPAPDGSPLRIGAAPPCLQFGGRMDEVELWSRALSDDEIAAMYRANAACGGRPDSPRRLAPGDGARVTEPLTLDWSASGCATSYRLEVRQGSKTGPLVVVRTGLKASEADVDVAKGRTYWWRPSACNGAGCSTGAWSSFTTKA